MAFSRSGRSEDLESPLLEALAALGLNADLEQRNRVLAYVSLLQRWNAVHNLSAVHDTAELLQQHVVDCLAIVGPFVRQADGRALKVLDAGTGAGLPAVVLATMRPDWTVTAVDSVGKKAAFLRQVAGELRLVNLRPQHARLQDLRSHDEPFDVVTSRAFGSLPLFVESTKHLIAPRGLWAAMKGKRPDAEIRGLPSECQLFHVEPLTVPGLAAERCLVWLTPNHGTGTH